MVDLTKLRGVCRVEAQGRWHSVNVVGAAMLSCAQAGVVCGPGEKGGCPGR